MKKLMLFAMAILLCGCSGNTKKEETKKTVYKDGTYTTTATGYGGEFQVETTIKNDIICIMLYTLFKHLYECSVCFILFRRVHV